MRFRWASDPQSQAAAVATIDDWVKWIRGEPCEMAALWEAAYASDDDDFDDDIDDDDDA